MRGVIGLNPHIQSRKRQRVAKRNKIAGAFSPHDSGEFSDARHIALFDAARPHGLIALSGKDNAALRDRAALSLGLGRNIDHARPAFFVKMGKVLGHLLFHQLFFSKSGH